MCLPASGGHSLHTKTPPCALSLEHDGASVVRVGPTDLERPRPYQLIVVVLLPLLSQRLSPPPYQQLSMMLSRCSLPLLLWLFINASFTQTQCPSHIRGFDIQSLFSTYMVDVRRSFHICIFCGRWEIPGDLFKWVS